MIDYNLLHQAETRITGANNHCLRQWMQIYVTSNEVYAITKRRDVLKTAKQYEKKIRAFLAGTPLRDCKSL